MRWIEEGLSASEFPPHLNVMTAGTETNPLGNSLPRTAPMKRLDPQLEPVRLDLSCCFSKSPTSIIGRIRGTR